MRVVVAMSGGVDSSVSALLLKEQGHDVIGVFLRNGVAASAAGRAPGKGHGCCGATDALDAEEVANALAIPFHALDHAREFGRIVDDFVEAHARGETPNPCVQCNRELKFGALFEFARALGAERVATGHYARLRRRPDASPDGVELLRARDRAKDQSYVLATVPPATLARALFPVGGLLKQEVREHARRAGLPVHAKAESQELCFVATGDYRDLLRERRPALFREGIVRDGSGAIVGTHAGAAGFTIGQRRGLRLAMGEPRYVVATQPETNEVVVGTRAEVLRRRGVLAGVSWLLPEAERPPLAGSLRVRLQVRAHHEAVPASVRELDGGRRAPGGGSPLELDLDPPGAALAPGQLGVLYDAERGERVLGAGTLRVD